MNVALNDLPDHCRIWIYQAPRALTVEEREVISAELENFTADWQAHGKDLYAGYGLFYRRFIVLAVDETVQEATGCSVDDSVTLIQNLQKTLNLDLMDRLQVAFRSENDLVVSVKLDEFKQLVEEGDVDEKTIVFNNLVSNLGEFRTDWEVPAAKSWHSRYFESVQN
ncbi:MAG: ABC transporter ATPase [Flavobacteriia bacterium]|nr:ABC transporter ATPase [Flavobacteriia bacterium]